MCYHCDTVVPEAMAKVQPADASRLQSTLQIMKPEYGMDTSASFSTFFFGTLESEEPTHNGGQAATPYLPFRKLVQKARESISIPDQQLKRSTS